LVKPASVYQFIVPVGEVVTPIVTVPVPQPDPFTAIGTPGMPFTVAVTAVLVAERHEPFTASA
jgi:hypothetical protein